MHSKLQLNNNYRKKLFDRKNIEHSDKYLILSFYKILIFIFSGNKSPHKQQVEVKLESRSFYLHQASP